MRHPPVWETCGPGPSAGFRALLEKGWDTALRSIASPAASSRPAQLNGPLEPPASVGHQAPLGCHDSSRRVKLRRPSCRCAPLEGTRDGDRPHSDWLAYATAHFRCITCTSRAPRKFALECPERRSHPGV